MNAEIEQRGHNAKCGESQGDHNALDIADGSGGDAGGMRGEHGDDFGNDWRRSKRTEMGHHQIPEQWG